MGRIKKGQTRRTPIRSKGDNYISEWQRNIWVEFGTLANRTRSHKFKSARREKSIRWKGGIKPVLAADKAWGETQSTVIANIPKEVKKSAEKYDKKK